MAGPDQRAAAPAGLGGSGLRIGIVKARWNDEIVDRLLDGVQRGLDSLGVAAADRMVVEVPGSFELPLAAQALARRADVDAVIALGVVIRGETVHFDLVAEQAAAGLARVQLDTGVPVAFGILATEDEAQARARSGGPGEHNVGEDCAVVAVEMARLIGHLA